MLAECRYCAELRRRWRRFSLMAYAERLRQPAPNMIGHDTRYTMLSRGRFQDYHYDFFIYFD